MDTIFYNGKLFTLDKAYPQCSAMAIKDGIIVRLGEDKELLSLADDNTETIDLKGKLMVPGFVDTHMHLIFYAQEISCIDLSSTCSFQDIRKKCSEKLQWAKDNNRWVYGVGFNHDDWQYPLIPTRKDLDTISTDVPVVIRRTCHHISICNTKALEEAALTESCPDGIVKELEQNRISDAMPLPSYEEIKELILSGSHELAAKGITEVHTDDFHVLPGDAGETIMNAYIDLAESNQLPVRIYEQCNLERPEFIKQFLDKGHRTGETHGFFRIGPLKFLGDGSLGAHTAYMRRAYENDSGSHGILNYTDEELYAMFQTAQENDMQIAIHCIGDGSLQQALDTFERIQRENPKADMRHGVIHCQIMDALQQDEFKKHNLLAYIQPVFIRSDMNIVDDCVGEDLAKSSYNWRRFEDLGVHQSGGSDCPVEKFDILPNIQYAVTRTDYSTGKSWYKENSLTLEEAIRAFTYEGAFASHSENVKGSLTVGKYADLTVLSENLFSLRPENVHKAQVSLTMTGGKITYRSKDI